MAYSESCGASAVPPTSSAPNSCIAEGLCMPKAGSDSEAMKPANGLFSSMVTELSPSGVHDL